MTTASAPGKIILFGEHSVVYGRPAIAIPVDLVRVAATVTDLADGRPRVHVRSRMVGVDAELAELAPDDPLAAAITEILHSLGVNGPRVEIEIDSAIPMAAGLGSGAAVTIALARALSEHFGQPFPAEEASRIAFLVDRIHHGTPSGIDNTVIAYEQPIYFVKDQDPVPFRVAAEVPLVIADSGISSPTAESVALVRSRWLGDRPAVEAMFHSIAQIVDSARVGLESGDVAAVGPVMNANQRILQQLGVSTPQLDALIATARAAGADGAKLSGGGLGGNIIALVASGSRSEVAQALREAGAVNTIETSLRP